MLLTDYDDKLQLHNAIYRLRFCSNSLIYILSLSNSHNNVASIQKNRGDKSHRVIVTLDIDTSGVCLINFCRKATQPYSLRIFLKKFFGRCQDLIEKYQRPLKEMVNDPFPG